jgi:uncharacterized protein YegP (UPF0339 family)
MTRTWFEIVRTRRGYKPRLRAANNRILWYAEHYSSRNEATTAIENLAALFYRAADSWPAENPTEIRIPGHTIPMVDIDKRLVRK